MSDRVMLALGRAWLRWHRLEWVKGWGCFMRKDRGACCARIVPFVVLCWWAAMDGLALAFIITIAVAWLVQ